MPSWTEIQDYARSKYTLSVDEDDRFALIFSFDDGRSQQIWVRRFEAFDQECIEFRTIVCKEGEIDATTALRKNAELAVGSLAAEGGLVFLMHNALLRTLDIDEFEIPLHVLAACADDLEAEYSLNEDAY